MGIYKAGKPFAMLQQEAPDSNTKFLLHSNTTDGSTTFTDSSTANITITAESAPAHKTAHSKFGDSSIFFDGSNDYLQVPHSNNFPLGGAARTIDCWVYQHTTPQAAYYFSYGVGPSAGTIFGVSSNSGNWYFQGYGSADFATGVAIVQHKWHHIAATYDGTTTRLYLNGTLIGSEANSINTAGTTLIIGGSAHGSANQGNEPQTCYIDEFRVSDVVRWTENFTPPTSPYANTTTFNIDSIGGDASNKDIILPSNPDEVSTDVAFGVSSNVGAPLLDVYAGGEVGVGASDTPTSKFEVHSGEQISGSKFSISSGNDSYTKLLIHSDTTDGSTTFVDSSDSSRVITAVGTAQHSTAQKKLGATGMLLDGNSDYLTIPITTDFQMGTGDWTIDYWIHPTNLSGVQNHISGNGNDQLLQLRQSDDGLNFELNGAGGSLNPTNCLTQNVWQHIAAVRQGDVFYAYVNGIQVGSDAISGAVTPATQRWIGARDAGGGAIQLFVGYMDEFRISKGIARWTSNFTPPTRPYGDALTVDGPKGNLYTVTDSIESHGSGSVFSVNTTGGLPALNVFDNGCVTKPYIPAFSVALSGTQHDIAVGSSYIPIQFNTDSGGGNFNQGGHYNTSNYTFTAPVTGKYQFNALIQIFNLDVDADYYELLLETSNKIYDAVMIDPNAFDQDVPYWYFNMSILTAMDVGDTCILNIRQLGASSAAQADVTANSVYSGYLVC